MFDFEPAAHAGSRLTELKGKHAELEQGIQRRVGRKDALEAQIDGLKSQIVTLNTDILNTEKAVLLLQSYSADQQAMLSERIENIVTSGLRAVFQDPTLTFKLKYSESKGGKVKKTPEVSISVEYEHEGNVVSGDLAKSFGGGLAVVTAVLLNVVLVLHLQPRVRPVLFLDEPLAALSPAYDGADELANGLRERMGAFCQTLTDETPVQLVVVSHEDQYSEIASITHRLSGGVGKTPKLTTSKRSVIKELEG